LFHLVTLAAKKRWQAITRDDLREFAQQNSDMTEGVVDSAVGQLAKLYWKQVDQELHYITKIGQKYSVNHRNFITDATTARIVLAIADWPPSPQLALVKLCTALLHLSIQQVSKRLTELLQYGYITHYLDAIVTSERFSVEIAYLTLLGASIPSPLVVQVLDGAGAEDSSRDISPSQGVASEPPRIDSPNFLRALFNYDEMKFPAPETEGLPPVARGILTIDESNLLRRLIAFHRRTRWGRSVDVEQLGKMIGAASAEEIRAMADDLTERGYLKTDDRQHYRVIRDAFAQWTRSAIFLLELYRTEPGEHVTVPVRKLWHSLRIRFSFEEAWFRSDLMWSAFVPKVNVMRPRPSYVLCYYNDDEISVSDRFEHEIDFLILGAEEYAQENPERAEEVRGLIEHVSQLRQSQV